MWIPFVLAGGALIIWLYSQNNAAPSAPASSPSAPDNTVGLTSGGAYYRGYLDQIQTAVATYNAGNRGEMDKVQLMKTLNAVMAVATKDSGWSGHLTTTDMYNLNEAYKAAIPV